MLVSQDFQVIGLYLLLLCVIGWSFRRFTTNHEEYFVSGRRMRWWLLGADSFQSNFSCWVFTGAAGVAYTHGGLIFGFYLLDVLAFALAYLWFAGRFRQLRVVTAIDAVRLRFGARDERFFAILSVVVSLSFASLRVLGLAVLLYHGFGFPTEAVIALTVTVLVFVALLGGSWGVAAMNLVQLVILVGVTTVVAVMAIMHSGGWSSFLAQIPSGHWSVLKPAGTNPYDWIFIVSSLLGVTYAKNNLLFVSKYAAASDVVAARKSSLIPLAGYLIMPVVWMIPAFAAFSLVPDLPLHEGAGKAGEWAYIAVCTKILPPGLLGLIVVCMLATTVSSVGLALNVNAGALTQNIYRPWRGAHPTSGELVIAGRIITIVLGLLIAGGCLLLSSSELSLFDALLYIGAYVNIPVTIPLFLGLFIRDEPWWAPRATVVWCAVLTLAVYHGLPAVVAAWAPPARIGDVLAYLAGNRFVATNLVVVPASVLFFWATARWSSSLTFAEKSRQAEFFARLNTPLPPGLEDEPDQTAQNRLLGYFLAATAIAILGIAFLAHSSGARLGISSCALPPAGLATALLWRRSAVR